MKNRLHGTQMSHHTRLALQGYHDSGSKTKNERAMMMLKRKPGKPFSKEEMEISREDRVKK